MSFAIIETGGKQYKVSASKILEIEKLDAKVGETVKKGEKVYTLFGKNIKKLESAKSMLHKTFKVSSETILKPKLILS